MKHILTAFCILLITACTDLVNFSSDNTPRSVADTFWYHMLSLDHGNAALFAFDPSHVSSEDFSGAKPVSVQFESMSQQDGVYFIETDLLFELKNTQHQVSLYTIVQSKDGNFLVNYLATKQSAVDRVLHMLTDRFSGTLMSTETIFKGALPELNDDEQEHLLSVFRQSLNEIEQVRANAG